LPLVNRPGLEGPDRPNNRSRVAQGSGAGQRRRRGGCSGGCRPPRWRKPPAGS